LAPFKQPFSLTHTHSVGRQPVEDDIDMEAEALLLAQIGDVAHRLLARGGVGKLGIGSRKVADKQLITAANQKWIEAERPEPQNGGKIQPLPPITAWTMHMEDARVRLSSPTRLSHPGLRGRGLKAPAHTL
jgi:hypothetical protein